MVHQMVTWPMTSRDPKRPRSWPRYIWSQISRKRLEIGLGFNGTPIGNPICHMILGPKHIEDTTLTFQGHVTSSITLTFWGLVTSRDLERSRSWQRYNWCQISRKRLEIGTWFQWSTNMKLHMANRIVMWPMTSRDLKRSRSWPQSQAER